MYTTGIATYLGGIRQVRVHPQIPDGVVLDGGHVLGDGDGDGAVRLADAGLQLERLVKGDGVQLAHGVVVQPDAVGARLVLVQGVGAVSCRGTVEPQINLVAGGYGRVVGDALIDVDAGVVTLSPSYPTVLVIYAHVRSPPRKKAIWVRMVLRRYLSKAEALPAKMEATAMEIFMLMVRKGQRSGKERQSIWMR